MCKDRGSVCRDRDRECVRDIESASKDSERECVYACRVRDRECVERYRLRVKVAGGSVYI